VGIESTIVDCSRRAPVLLRPGAISIDQLEQACGQRVHGAHDTVTDDAPAPRASGTLLAHYAPKAKLRLMAAGALQTALDMLGGDVQPSSGDIPEERLEQTRRMAEALGDKVYQAYPFCDGTRPMGDDNVERILNRTWRPALSVTGVGGMPALADAGNVLRPETALKLSMRLPPTLDGEEASANMKSTLEADPPYGAKVAFEGDQSATGWNAPAVAPWLHESLDKASKNTYGPGVMYMGEGGTIPFMAMLGDAFPAAQFMITGVLGPNSNAHGPNEFIHIPFARKLTTCVAQVIADHHNRPGD
jgi:acetylornithine deacetylase/succinyl-diaminopimelate desuccinylase-like protein